MTTPARLNDQLIRDRGRYVMVPVGKGQRQCLSKEEDIGFQCQLVKNHKGPHKFWKESPLIGWKE